MRALTSDERLVLSTTVTLHGFELWEQFDKDRGLWRPFLLGRPLGDGLHEAVVEWIKPPQVSPRRSKTGIPRTAQRLPWFKLTDHQLQAFHDTVVSTC